MQASNAGATAKQRPGCRWQNCHLGHCAREALAEKIRQIGLDGRRSPPSQLPLYPKSRLAKKAFKHGMHAAMILTLSSTEPQRMKSVKLHEKSPLKPYVLTRVIFTTAAPLAKTPRPTRNAMAILSRVRR